MTRKRLLLSSVLVLALSVFQFNSQAQSKVESSLPTRGFCIAAPKPAGLDAFIKFVNEELAPRGVNTLILRVDFNYQYEGHPELRDTVALSKADVKKIVAACKKNNIRLIPQINLLGHQSWAQTTYALLRVYPQFDETPHVQMPAKYVWPNADGLYCKSYCPLHLWVFRDYFIDYALQVLLRFFQRQSAQSIVGAQFKNENVYRLFKDPIKPVESTSRSFTT